VVPQQAAATDLPVLDVGDEHRLDPGHRGRRWIVERLVFRRTSSRAARMLRRAAALNPVPLNAHVVAFLRWLVHDTDELPGAAGGTNLMRHHN
jgi:hypothetical protein